MPQIRFSLKSSDRIRLLKDRLARCAVTAGGISVLGALILIFVYLVWVVVPLFSKATLDIENRKVAISVTVPAFLSIDEYGQYAFIVDKSGKTEFLSLKKHQSELNDQHGQLPFHPDKWFKSDLGHWLLVIGERGQSFLIRPEFTDTVSGKSHHFHPQVRMIQLSETVKKLLIDAKLVSFSVHSEQLKMAVYTTAGQLHWFSQHLSTHSSVERKTQLSVSLPDVQELRLTPDGKTLYIRNINHELLVAKQNKAGLYIRDVIDTEKKNSHIVSMHLLPGASSLLTVYSNGDVVQWFDVLKNGQRKLTSIRSFALGRGLDFILPNVFSKGFFAIYQNGSVRSYFTTSDKRIKFGTVYPSAPGLAVFSQDERKLVTLNQDNIYIADVDLGYPDVSFSALWNKVWYENYPEPEYVWQSTSASNIFEPKFSLVPIAFGTIKAAMFAMLFSVPIAVLAAIYTAYFMTPRMRGIVKPTIELMEALPTVIIGFLAGLWFAPIVERHLVSSVLMIVVLPVSTIVAGALWKLLPKKYSRWTKKGWHTIVLFPVLAAVMAIVLPLSFDIEQWLFGGDIRVFLAEYGFNFDQRNALVVGLAMGFAVIPTIFTIAEDAVFSVPKHLSDGSLALGATQWQTLKHVVLLTASPGIFSGIMMGLGRAVGETMIVLMATGNTPIMNWNILEGMRTLAATIAVELPESEVGSSHYRILFLAALILFVFTFIVNSLAEWIRLRLREKYRAL
ncbi:ABC transporter permease subunit [Vibrio salinus]|uniref:ABC transporter permease subunit n=1 Tax=Vibrio salinus TaxID=2899784 RepID=UPI001E3DD7C7|nr:ABC transporter permease subunit [Vibrio salinus]MCE0493198.1 ABC transporter permease subunit [Vibrio salinus]